MNRQAVEKHLRAAEKVVAQGEEHIRKQQRFPTVLERDNHPTKQRERFCAITKVYN